jgi:hypothetical protein
MYYYYKLAKIVYEKTAYDDKNIISRNLQTNIKFWL